MKAAYITRHGDTDVLEVGELPTPVAGPGEALVRLKASALNHLDVWVRKGLPGLKLSYPHILGGDGSGVVASVGPGVTGIKEGDEAIVHPGLSCLHCEACLSGWESLCPEYRILGEHVSGTNAEYVAVPVANLFPKPKGISFAEAAAIPLVFTTAWQMAVRRAAIRPGDLVLIHAAGSGVSSAAIQIARLFGADVIATAGSEPKLELARKLGARYLIDYRNTDIVGAVRAISRSGVDVILDHTGKDLWEKNIRALKAGGKLVLCGATSGWEANTDLRHVFYRQLQILGSTMGSKADFPAILRQIATGGFRAVVDTVLPLVRIAEAHRHLENREQFGKVVLEP